MTLLPWLRWFSGSSIALGLLFSATGCLTIAEAATADSSPIFTHPSPAPSNFLEINQPLSTAAAPKQAASPCRAPALARMTRYRIASGDTLAAIAQRHNLIPATLMGFNPNLRDGSLPVGAEIVIPPFNGIRVEVPAGKTWRDVAEQYNVRADVLFEINGCQEAPRAVFVPGVNWAPAAAGSTTPSNSANRAMLNRYPLPSVVPVMTAYGWQLDPAVGEVVFHSGVKLAAAADTPVLAVGEGVVAFAADQGNFGNLVVVNHSQGLQSRYAHLSQINVRVGQTVGAGDRLGLVGSTGVVTMPHLYFEVRTNSNLGWIARDPSQYFEEMRFRGEAIAPNPNS